jgi:hypothetical protein
LAPPEPPPGWVVNGPLSYRTVGEHAGVAVGVAVGVEVGVGDGVPVGVAVGVGVGPTPQVKSLATNVSFQPVIVATSPEASSTPNRLHVPFIPDPAVPNTDANVAAPVGAGV